jgi:hypothetical protein
MVSCFITSKTASDTQACRRGRFQIGISVAEWNVGCEKCHGPGSDHVARQDRPNIINPAKLDYVQANDACVQCHSQGQPLMNPIKGKYYDWPVGFSHGQETADGASRARVVMIRTARTTMPC